MNMLSVENILCFCHSFITFNLHIFKTCLSSSSYSFSDQSKVYFFLIIFCKQSNLLSLSPLHKLRDGMLYLFQASTINRTPLPDKCGLTLSTVVADESICLRQTVLDCADFHITLFLLNYYRLIQIKYVGIILNLK